MPSMSEFAGTLDHRLRAMEEFRRAEAGRLSEEMRPREVFHQAFDRVADIVVTGIIRPRVETVADRFQKATLESMQTPMGIYVGCTFSPTDTFPVAALLCVGIAMDDERQLCALSLSADLQPAAPGHVTTAVHPVNLAAPQWDAMITWVEAQLLGFIDAYVDAHRLAATRQDNLVRDPVCGMMVSPSVAPEHWSFDGETYSFCARSCREQFMANPRVFLDGLARARAQ